MYLTVDFGTISATVGYTLKNAAGGDAQARTQTGVTDLGNGMYGVEVDLVPAAVAVKWDTGGGAPIFAHEDLVAEQNNLFLRNRRDLTQGGANNQKIYRDDGVAVYMQGNAYQDQAGGVAYAGKGVERTDRLG